MCCINLIGPGRHCIKLEPSTGSRCSISVHQNQVPPLVPVLLQVVVGRTWRKTSVVAVAADAVVVAVVAAAVVHPR